MVNSGSDQEELNPDVNSAAGILYKHRDDFLTFWLSEIKKYIRAANKEKVPVLVDTLPAFIVNMVQALMPDYPRSNASDGTTIAQEHGGERARISNYSPEDVIREYQILRESLLHFINEKKPLLESERTTIVKSCDRAMTEALNAYFLIETSIKERFISTLTHDLRTPLTAIKASAQLIMRNPSKNDQHVILASRIVENVARMDRMIEDVLDASRIRAGEVLNMVFLPCNLYRVVEDTLDELSITHGGRFLLTGESVDGFCSCDSIKRALENLCVNAIKYGDPVAPISVKIEEAHGRILISVHNVGSYIPAEEQETLFKSFMRSRSAKQGTQKGWGIGLALVRGVAEAHGGSIGIDSSEEKGTTFIMDILLDPRIIEERVITPGS